MTVSLADLERSFRRAPRRRDVFLMLASLSEASPTALARACGIDPTRLKWMMHGRWPYYREGLGLVTLGLVEEGMTPNGRVYRITSLGRKKARQLTARSARRAIAARAVRAHLRRSDALDEGTSGSA